MDRRAVLGKSKAELVMARVGEVMAACYFLLLLPVLPFLLAYLVIQKLLSAGSSHQYEPSFEP